MVFDLRETADRADTVYRNFKKVTGIRNLADARRKAVYVKARVNRLRKGNLGSLKGIKSAAVRAVTTGNLTGLEKKARKAVKKEAVKFYKA